MYDFKKAVERLQSSVDSIKRLKIAIDKKVDPAKSLYDFKEKKYDYYKNTYHTTFKDLKAKSAKLVGDVGTKIKELVVQLEKEYTKNDLEGMKNILNEIHSLSESLKSEEVQKWDVGVKNIPDDIKEDVKADLSELEKCFSAGCYRSCVILCGRLMETALHRKYYDVTGQDILEKNPGIGLGKVIAKLDENKVELDPGLTQQIHLINQVRVFSVHKKQRAFYPSKAQANGIILFTTDVLEKVFT